MQKLYSALSNLDKFNKESNFFDNISSLDAFFSEFRSITFVLQQSLAHTNYKKHYEKLCDKYLINDSCKWLNDTRVSTVHKKPFELTKEVRISIYLPAKGFNVCSYKFTIENDIEVSTLLDELKVFLCKLHPVEIFFSAQFIFYESNSDVDIYDKISFGIKQIKLLLSELKTHINKECDLCEKLEKKIDNFHFGIALRDMLLVDDYVYYPQKDIFERANRVGVSTNGIDVSFPRTPISNDKWNIFGGNKTINFDKFVMMNIIIGSVDLLPAIMIVYDDETFEMDTYQSTIKTTGYRKINETAKKVKANDVKEVFIMQTYTEMKACENMFLLTAKERIQRSIKDILVFMKADKYLNTEEYFFEDNHIMSKDYLNRKLREGSSKHFVYGALNMQPIVDAFTSKIKGTE